MDDTGYMGTAEEIKRDLHEMVVSGDVNPEAAKRAQHDPVQMDLLVRTAKVARATFEQSLALFGDKKLGVTGLVTDMLDVKATVNKLASRVDRVFWMAAGGTVLGTTIGGAFISLLSLWIAWKKG